jgi:ectoine hydroxylase-related dioxygenase (phytanoyl-CoA dioxygenase family)
MAEDVRELRVTNDARHDPVELRRRLSEDGYVFLKRLQDPDGLLALRRQIMGVLQKSGWLVAGTDPMDGIADLDHRCTEGDPEYHDVYHRVQCLESFHAWPHRDELTSMVSTLLGAPCIPIPQKIARIWFPQFTQHTTPIHQDFVHFQGSLDTLTAWSPVGECPKELGGLAVLPRSHTLHKVLAHHFALGAGGLSVDVPEEARAYPVLDGPWYTTDFEVGDTLFFPALTLHKALPNVTPDRLRVSLDNRYTVVGGRIADHMLTPHLSDGTPLSWETVYAGWKDDELKYYWKKIPFTTTRRWMGYGEKGFAEALLRAARGDERAVLALRRVAKLAPDTPEGKKAKAALAAAGLEERIPV